MKAVKVSEFSGLQCCLDILHIFICVPQKKESHTGLIQHDDRILPFD